MAPSTAADGFWRVGVGGRVGAGGARLSPKLIFKDISVSSVCGCQAQAQQESMSPV